MKKIFFIIFIILINFNIIYAKNFNDLELEKNKALKDVNIIMPVTKEVQGKIYFILHSSDLELRLKNIDDLVISTKKELDKTTVSEETKKTFLNSLKNWGYFYIYIIQGLKEKKIEYIDMAYKEMEELGVKEQEEILNKFIEINKKVIQDKINNTLTKETAEKYGEIEKEFYQTASKIVEDNYRILNN